MAMKILVICVMAMATLAMAKIPKRPSVDPFAKNYEAVWAPDHMKHLNNDKELHLVLDKNSGAGFRSKGTYLFGHFSMDLKLVGGDSSGVVTAFYLASQNSEHDEIDFEFLGNKSGHPYILQTNVFTGGEGNREQRIYLWFDPTKKHHRYSVIWNMHMVALYVDNVPIRVFKNSRDIGVKYPFDQPMRVYSSLWNADDWATRGGLDKTNWAKAPFVASYRGFHINGCEASVEKSKCKTEGLRWWDRKEFHDIDTEQRKQLKWVRKRYTIYNYCEDRQRFPNISPECARDRDL